MTDPIFCSPKTINLDGDLRDASLEGDLFFSQTQLTLDDLDCYSEAHAPLVRLVQYRDPASISDVELVKIVRAAMLERIAIDDDLDNRFGHIPTAPEIAALEAMAAL